jgi:hypothetical protein
MAELKRAVQVAHGHGSVGALKNRLPEGAKVTETKAFGGHEVGKYTAPGCSPESVLIEWRPFNSAAHQLPEELLRRVDASVNISNVKSKPQEVRVLECIGFYEDANRRSFGILYRLAQPTAKGAQTALEPTSLFDLIASTSNTAHGKPYLGERFEIARSVAACIQYCHGSNWLHKRLNSYNVVFLVPPDSKVARRAGSPYIIGFNHSREDKEDEYSYGPPSDPTLTPYLHPKYFTTRRFRKLFDYYSVGLVLLEVGIWRTARSIRDEHPYHNSEGLREEFVARCLPELAYSMGEIYSSAVRACLTGELGSIDTPEEDVVNAFRTLVIGRLQQCRA